MFSPNSSAGSRSGKGVVRGGVVIPLVPSLKVLASSSRRFSGTEEYFFPGGEPLAEGSTLVNRQYAATLRRIAEEGTGAFYRGQIAQDIVGAVRGAEGNPGVLSETDLAVYDPSTWGLIALVPCASVRLSGKAEIDVVPARIDDQYCTQTAKHSGNELA